jgi:peptidoglycan hydrolase-like protein with peptidoglycan-binding domain
LVLFCSAPVSAASNTLKKESRGTEVTTLQKDLVKLGYLDAEPTGFYGDATVAAVREVQKEYGYEADGIAGSTTQALISRLLGKSTTVSGTTASGKKVTSTTSSSASGSGALKEGAKGDSVKTLQQNLVKLGYLSCAPTGYFGTATEQAVKKLQKASGYSSDGVAGSKTLALISKLIAAKTAPVKTLAAASGVKAVESTASNDSGEVNYKLPWYGKVNDLFSIGKKATVYDIETGLSFNIKRTYGHNHADCETLTDEDTAIMKKIYGGKWSWDRRAVIVTVGDVKIAASMAGMPHAGSERYSANTTVSSRSGGYGRGENLDAIKGNAMSGVFDLHFYGSKTHGSNKVDSKHQSMVNAAVEWAKKNL